MKYHIYDDLEGTPLRINQLWPMAYSSRVDIKGKTTHKKTYSAGKPLVSCRFSSKQPSDKGSVGHNELKDIVPSFPCGCAHDLAEFLSFYRGGFLVQA
jgi:hypothetical protein